jgi:hypothetical protein
MKYCIPKQTPNSETNPGDHLFLSLNGTLKSYMSVNSLYEKLKFHFPLISDCVI